MLTREHKMALCEDYKNPNITVDEIAKKYGTYRTNVAHIAVEMGAEPRHNVGQGGKGRVCPKCRKKIEVKGAKFCCYCGTDIRSAEELLIERVERACTVVLHLPENMRDEMQRLLLDVVATLKKGVRG